MRPFEPNHAYYAYADFAGGSGQDSAALAAARGDGDRSVICRVAEWHPLFDPTHVVKEIVETLREYSLNSLMGDKFSGAT